MSKYSEKPHDYSWEVVPAVCWVSTEVLACLFNCYWDDVLLHVASCLLIVWLQCSRQSSGVNIIIVLGSISCFICCSCLERVYCFGSVLVVVHWHYWTLLTLNIAGRLCGRRGLGQTGLWSWLSHRMHQTMAGYKKSVPNLQENSTGHLRHGCLFPP